MSGIYIPWMSMPKTCDDCQVSADCPNDEHIDGYNMQNRPRFCQLVPVPPHGRLTDADALIAWFEEWYDPNADLEICHVIDILGDNSVTPTIIPASEEGET